MFPLALLVLKLNIHQIQFPLTFVRHISIKDIHEKVCVLNTMDQKIVDFILNSYFS